MYLKGMFSKVELKNSAFRFQLLNATFFKKIIKQKKWKLNSNPSGGIKRPQKRHLEQVDKMQVPVDLFGCGEVFQ